MRARVNLVMNNWGEAATDAEAALSGYTFLSKDDVSAPGFNSANSPSWIWAGIYKAADTPRQLPQYHLGRTPLLLCPRLYHQPGFV